MPLVPAISGQIPLQGDPAPPDSAGADSTSAIDQIGDQVSALGDLVLAGEWSQAWNRTTTAIASWGVEFLPTVFRALFVGILFYAVYRGVYRVAERVLSRSNKASSGLGDIALNGIRAVGLALVGLLFLSQLGIDVTAAVAGLGIAGLALGFAAKDTLENFISGVTILLDRPFAVGDTVEVEDVYGRVSRFTLRSTRIRTLDRRILVMPNVRMINQKLINHSALVPVRVQVPFGIAYKESIDQARDVVLATVDADDDRFSSEQPQVRVRQMAASSIEMELWLFVREAADEVPLKLEYTERIRKALVEADIEVPFPHLQVFIDGAEGLRGLPVQLERQSAESGG